MNVSDGIVRFNLAATVAFAVTAVYAAMVFDTTAQWVGAATAMSLFAIGVFAFLWSYVSALNLSRTHNLFVAELYLLLGKSIPKAIKVPMIGLVVVQFGIALTTTLLQPYGPEGNPGSSLAVGFLVPMLGFGLNGLWAVRHGEFPTRVDSRRQNSPNGIENRQNANHG